MLYAIHDGPMTIVAAADNLVELEAFQSAASRDGEIVDHRRPEPFEMLSDDRYRGLRVPPLVFEFADNAARDSFAARHGLVLVKQNALIDKHADMLAAQEQDPYSGDFDDKRKIGEIHGLDQSDPWDRRSDAQKAQDEQMKKLYEEAKKAGTLSGDGSFAAPKDPRVQITDIHSTEHADGTVTIDNVLAVKGLHEDTAKEIEEAEAAARAKPKERALDKMTVDPANGSWSVDLSGCVGANGEVDIGAFADLTHRMMEEAMADEGLTDADAGEEDDGTVADPNDPAAYLFHAENTINPFDGVTRLTLVVIGERATFERTGELTEGDLPFALPKGFDATNKPIYVYKGSEEAARALLEHVGLKQTRAFREACRDLIAAAAADEETGVAADYLFHINTDHFDGQPMVFVAEASAFESFSEDDDDLDELLGTDLRKLLTPSLHDGFKPYERFYLYEGDPATAASVLDHVGMKQSPAFSAFCEQIIEDGEIDEWSSKSPDDYLFHARTTSDPYDRNQQVTLVVITPEIYFVKEGYLYDQHLAVELPDGFDCAMEGQYTFKGTVEEARAALLAAGFRESAKFSNEPWFADDADAGRGDDDGDDEPYEPSDVATDYLFHAMPNPDERMMALVGGATLVCIVEEAYFAKHGAIADHHVSEVLDLPEAFEEMQEGDFLFDGSVEEARAILLGLGLKESADLAAFLSSVVEAPPVAPSVPPGYDPKLLAVLQGIDARTGGRLGLPQPVVRAAQRFVVSVDADEIALVRELFTAAGLIALDASDDDLKARYEGVLEADDDGCRFGFRGSEREAQRLLAVLNHVMGAEAKHDDGRALAFDPAEARVIDGDPTATFHRLDIHVTDLGNHYQFHELLEQVIGDHVAHGLDGDVWWVAYRTEAEAARDARAVDAPSRVHAVDGLGNGSQRDPAWRPFTIEIAQDDGDFFGETFLSAAGILPLRPAPGDLERRVAWLGETRHGCRFTFWGSEREAQRLMAVIHSVTDLLVVATRADGTPMPLDLAVAQHIDPEGPIAIYFRVDLLPTAFLEDERMFVSALRDANCEDKIVARGATPEGWWVAFQREFDAEQFGKAIDDIFVHLTQPWELYGVNDKGERLVPKGAATVVDPARLKDEEPRPWNDRASELDAMDEEARAANRKGMKGSEFIFCGSYQGVQHGCVINVTPKSWFERHGTLWEGPLDIAHLLPQDLKEVAPGLYTTKSRDWNNLSHDMARRGFKENLFLQLHLNSL